MKKILSALLLIFAILLSACGVVKYESEPLMTDTLRVLESRGS